MAKTLSIKAERVREAVLQWIEQGRLAQGDQLPPEREMARLLDMNHLTVRRGLQSLVDQGVIVKQPGVGNFVKSASAAPTLQDIALAVPEYMLRDHQRNPLVGMILDGLMDALDARQYRLTTLRFRGWHFHEDIIDLCLYRNVQGVILWGDPGVHYQEIELLLKTGTRMVLLTKPVHLMGLNVPHVTIQTGYAIAQAMRHLHRIGHRNVHLVLYTHSASREANEHLVRELFREHQVQDIDHRLHYIPNADTRPRYHPVLDQALDKRPSALIVPDEVAAQQVWQLCHQRGLRVPEDLSLIALSDNAPASHPVALAAPDTPQLHRRTGMLAGQYLRDLLQGKPQETRDLSLHPDIQWRESVRPPASPADQEAADPEAANAPPIG